ncbi:MAG: cardiolipin synthase B, partial [Verrucomicrobia bacterium]|nr:cardiolipin synthase B [Verrucomicrobiota bacterium]
MAAPVLNTAFRWLPNGDEAFAAMLAAIAAARHSVRLETYIFAASIAANASSPLGSQRNAVLR